MRKFLAFLFRATLRDEYRSAFPWQSLVKR
jgi:hypothetical protein